jgi:release factor glutamine methyltransferase
MTLHQSLAAARHQLEEAGLDAAAASIDAEVLARHLLGWDRASLLTRLRDSPPAGFEPRYEELIARRVRREPVALITGTREFWGRDFAVTRDTLVPRPESELIVEEALQALPQGRATVIDVGTGSGSLAVTLAAECGRARVVATDLSRAALDVAAANARRHHVDDRVRFVQTDLVAGLDVRAQVIVANPPYIPDRDAATLPVDVAGYEPPVALFGGPEGMSVIDRLLVAVTPLLAPGGAFIVEFGCGQESSVRASAEREGWQVRRVRHDLQGIARTAVLER